MFQVYQMGYAHKRRLLQAVVQTHGPFMLGIFPIMQLGYLRHWSPNNVNFSLRGRDEPRV